MTKKINKCTSIYLVITFFILFIVSAVVVLLAEALFPQAVVLGTSHINTSWVIIHSIATLALIEIFAIPFARIYENKTGRMLTHKDWLIYFFFVNFISIWIITRMPEQLGFGISSWFVAFLLSIVLDVVQVLAMIQLEKKRIS